MPLHGTCDDENPSLSPLTRGTPRFLRQGVKMKTPSQSPPYALRKGEKEFVSLDTNGF